MKKEQSSHDFLQMMTKVTVEPALNTEFDEHLGYDKNETPPTPIAETARPLRLLSDSIGV